MAGTGVLGSGATISFPSAAVGTPTALTLQVRNTGTAPATISNLVVSPSSFQLQNAPSLPLTIAANGSASLGLAFVPQAPGAITGALQIGGASFTLSGIGLGPQFTCMFTARGQTAPACTGSTISLPPVSLGDQLLFTVQVTNTGNQPGAIQNFAISGPGYSVAAAPSLPATLAAGDSIQVNASFAPTVLGIVGGYLQLNGQTYNLTVVVTAPPSLPAISITNLKPQMQALQQPLIGIHLAAPYPYDLTGRLTLSFTADSLIDDPAVQFLNGQRYVDFRVPAGSADAVFGTTATGVIFQTGSSAGAISLAASFTLGQYVLTGSSPVTQNVSIPAAAPQILSLQIGASDSAGFDLLITGVSTARSVTQLAFTLNPAKDSSLATPTLTADVSAAFNAWYQSALSRSYGGQFTVSVRFNVTGDITAIQGITATATNAQGTSDPQSIALPSSGTQ